MTMIKMETVYAMMDDVVLSSSAICGMEGRKIADVIARWGESYGLPPCRVLTSLKSTIRYNGNDELLSPGRESIKDVFLWSTRFCISCTAFCLSWCLASTLLILVHIVWNSSTRTERNRGYHRLDPFSAFVQSGDRYRRRNVELMVR